MTANNQETAKAIRHCLCYLLEDAVTVGLTNSAFHIRLAIEELNREIPQMSRPRPQLVKTSSHPSSPTE